MHVMLDLMGVVEREIYKCTMLIFIISNTATYHWRTIEFLRNPTTMHE